MMISSSSSAAASRRVGPEVTGDVRTRRRNDQQASNVVGAQFANVRGFLGRIVVLFAQDHAEGALVGHVLDAANHAREEWVRYIWNDHSEHVCPVSSQTSGQGTGLISEAANRFDIEFVEAGENAAKPLESPKQAFDLVAF